MCLPISVPYSINGDGAITGDYYAAGAYHGFLRAADGTITSFDPPGSTNTEARGINASGAITGYYVSSGIHGFLFQ